MSLPSNLKNLYAEWLQELTRDLNPRQEQLALTYEKARRHLLETEDPIYHPKDLKRIKGIGETIMKRLEKKLQIHCSDIGAEFPQSPSSSRPSAEVIRTTTVLRTKKARHKQATSDGYGEPDPSQKKRKQQYIPRKRSGGYGILLALLELKAISKGFSKGEIITTGQKYCDCSMDPNFMTKELRGAWSAVHSLIKHNLVLEEGRPKRYSLTEEGVQMAETLKVAAAITFEGERQISKGRKIGDDADETECTANLSALLGKNQGNVFAGDTSSLMDVTFGTADNQQELENGASLTNESLAISTPRSAGSTAVIGDSNAISLTTEGSGILNRKFNGVSYELWLNGSYELFPVIDHREIKSHGNRDFFSIALERKGMKCEIRQLALGDIIWIARNRLTGSECVVNTIIERKRLDDLALSIRDNRFMEQKSRLDKSGCKNKYYLIEETMSRTLDGMNEALKTAFWLILVYYRFSMIRTSNADETVEKLHALHKVITKEYTKKNLIVIYPNNLKNQDDYHIILKQFRSEFERIERLECCHSFQCFQEILGKGELSTISELTIKILMYIKGISIEKAVAIQNIYPTLNHILTAYRDCKNDEEAGLLMFTKLGEAPGAKKITKSLSHKIAQVFGSFKQ